MRRLLAAVLLLFSSLAAADGQQPTKADLDKLMAQTDQIAKTVSKLRALPVKKRIPRGIMSRAEITKRLILRLDEDYAPGEIASEALALKRLGLLAPDADYRQMVIDILTEQIAGFYDPEVKELYIADWIDTGLQRMVLAHEIDHALQDQSFNLNRFIKPNRDNGDEQLARQALVEGDGVAVMMEFLFREQGLKVDPWASDAVVNAVGAASGLGGGAKFEAAPLFLRESLLFPYKAGLRFIGAARKTHPWSYVDRMYRKPPLSTEQIMHPDKYRAGEKPVALKTPTLPSLRSWKRLYNNVIGEFMFSILLRQHGVAKPVADKAAAGWGDDRVMLFAPDADDRKLDDIVAVDFSTWDTESDAVEAQAALATVLPSLARVAASDAPAEKTESYRAYRDAAGRVTFAERRGHNLLLVVGAPAALAPRLRAEAWSHWKAGK